MRDTIHFSVRDREDMPTGAIVESGIGNRWRKREDGLWDCLTDPPAGPHSSADLPEYLWPTFPARHPG